MGMAHEATEESATHEARQLPELSRFRGAAVASVCLLAVALRLLFAWWCLPPLESDFYWYRQAGLAAERHGLTSLLGSDPPVPLWVLSLWPPGYALFLGLLYSVSTSIWVAPVVQAVLGGVSVLVVFQAARRWGGNPWVAAAITALYPHAIVYSAVHGAETLTIFLVSLAVLASVTPLRSREAAAYGCTLGFAMLTRCHVLLLLPGVAASLWRQRKALAIALVCLALVLTPWAVSRSLLYHRPVFITTFFGHLLYMGNHIDNETGGYHEAPRPIEIPSNVTGPEEDIYFATAGLREILLHPGHYLLVSARRALMWTGIEGDEWMQRYAPRWLVNMSMLAQLALFFAAAAAAVEGWRDPRTRYVVWPALSLVLLTALTYHMPRYALIALPYLSLIASRLRSGPAERAAAVSSSD